jgi:HD-like signal output (HDOD) protein
MAFQERAPPGTPSNLSERLRRELMMTEMLPGAPPIIHQLLGMIESEKTSNTELAGLIGRDPALTARLLQIANGALFGGREPIMSIQQALTRLGIAQVLDMIFAATLAAVLDHADIPSARRRGLWGHATSVAAAAKTLALRRRLDGATAMTTGLLHDVGHCVLGMRLGDVYWSVVDRAAAEHQSITVAESEAFGCEHAMVGEWLLQVWGLPPLLIESVSSHHLPLRPSAHIGIPQLVGIADRLVHARDPESGEVAPEALDALQVVVPGWLTAHTWKDVHAAIAREERALESIFLGSS